MVITIKLRGSLTNILTDRGKTHRGPLDCSAEEALKLAGITGRKLKTSDCCH